MALQGKLEADFGQFVGEAKKAETAINGMTGGAARFEKQMESAATPTTTYGQQIRQVDDALQQFGVNLTPVSKGISDLENALAKGLNNLSFVEKGVLAASAAMAGWQVGRKAAEFFDLDTKIGESTAKLLGWGDAAGERAAAKADALAKASKAVGFQITDLSTAMIVNTAKAQDMIAANQQAAATFAAEKKAATDLAAEIIKVHESNFQKFAATNIALQKASEERAAAEKAANEKATQSLFDEIDAATKANAAQKALRDAGVEGQTALKAKVDETTASLEQQALAAGKVALNETTYADFSDPTAAAGILARPSKSLEDFIRIYGGYSGGMAFAEKQYQIDQEIRRRAQAVLDAANATGYVGPGATPPINIHVNGVTITELTTAVGANLIQRTGAKVGI